MKKLKWLYLMILVFILATPVSVFCTTTSNSNFLFDTGTKTIYGYNGTYPKKLVVPSYINGVKVDAIREGAFDGADIDIIEIPENVYDLEIPSEGYSVFIDKNYLYDYNVVERDVEVVFYTGDKVGDFYIDRSRGAVIGYDGSASRDVVIPEKLDGMTVKEIGEYAFWGEGITSLTLPNSVEVIRLGAFCDNKLVDVVLPEKCSVIEAEAFWGNDIIRLTINSPSPRLGWKSFYENKINVAELPRNTKLSNGSWANSENLVSNQVFDSNVRFVFYDGVKYGSFYFDKATQTITRYSAHGGANVVIPQTIDGVAVKTIGGYAFRGTRINSVTIPEGVTKLEEYCLGYIDLASVTLPQSLETIEDSAFAGNKLTSVVLPNNLKHIELEAFRGNQLTSITIPGTVKKIGASAFRDNKLTNVVFNNGTEEIDLYAFQNNEIKELEFSDSIKIINSYAFYENPLEYVLLPKNLETIGDYSLYSNIRDDDNYKGVKIEGFNNIKNIYDSDIDTFRDFGSSYNLYNLAVCDYLGKVKTYDSDKYGDYFFDKSTNTIEGYSFKGTKDVVIPSEIDGVVVKKIGENAFSSRELTSVVIPNTVEEIDIYAFSINNIESINIPSSVKKIKDVAFLNNGLKEVNFENGLEEIGGWVFENNELTKVVLPRTIKTVSIGAFYDNKIESVFIPNGIEVIGENAFAENRLKAVEVPKTIKNIEKMNYENENKLYVEPTIENFNTYNVFGENGEIVFYDGFKVGDFYVEEQSGTIIGYSDFGSKDVVIPSELEGIPVVKIADGAFKGKDLTSVTLAESVEEIGLEAFMGNKLTNVVIPNSVKVIGNSVFSNNLLKTVTLSENLTEISDNAFFENNIESVIIPKGVSYIGRSAFESNKLSVIEIPSTVKEIGIRAFYGNNIRSVEVPSSIESIVGYKGTTSDKEYFEASKENLLQMNVFDSDVEIKINNTFMFMIIGAVVASVLVGLIVFIVLKKKGSTKNLELEEQNQYKIEEQRNEKVEEKNEYTAEIIETNEEKIDAVETEEVKEKR